MGLIKAPNPKACDIATLDDDHKIIKFVEKVESPESDLANGGIYLASNDILDMMQKSGGLNSANGF